MITLITCSMLDPPSKYEHDEMNIGVSKSTCLEPTRKQFMKETSIFCRESHNLLRRVYNRRPKIFIMARFILKEIRSYSICNTIRKQLRKEIVEWILSRHHFFQVIQSIFKPRIKSKGFRPKMLMEITGRDLYSYMIKKSKNDWLGGIVD